ncbi:ribose 5-phosphate isomerase A [Edhazardia aedis USNM 41457]|uniref:Ribose-5-phosphate isomerase n=1 Tax=Edhazardia aedis (strain USNM 41457) TaxID=1003232 RepID=J8ZSW7_EDHAE|nr:ribose 5-phosphate isomerase A [Edhazardia aedis USNM 41457]|eukprot:EJW02758.1 ribose 5-phosphate isomerase A [Edhazardia aedis USNM 41457]
MDSQILKYIEESTIVGIGTGKTINSLINSLPKDKTYVASSLETSRILVCNKYKTLNLSLCGSLDCYVDSADFVDSNGNLLKGGGGAADQEKLMMKMSRKTYIIIDKKKRIDGFGECTCAFFVLPCAMTYFQNILSENGLSFSLRMCDKKIGPIFSDNGNLIFDVDFNYDFIQNSMNICGVIANGFFLENEYKYSIIERKNI